MTDTPQISKNDAYKAINASQKGAGTKHRKPSKGTKPGSSAKQEGPSKPGSSERKLLSTPTLAVIAVILVLALALLLFFTLSPNKLEKDKSIVAGSVSGMTMDEIQRYLDDSVQASKVSTSVTNVVDVDASTKEAQWLIGNPEDNDKELRATVTRDDTGDVIYQSGVLKPGYYIPSAPLSADLPDGSYNCTVTFDVIDPSSGLIIGNTATQILVRVR